MRIALIGLGMGAEPHALSLLERRGRVEVLWAASRSPDRTAAFAQRFPFPTTNDIEAVLTDPNVEAVILATPPDTHLALGRRALAHGKHLLVEKPLAATTSDAAELVALADAADLRLGVVLQHRFRPAVERLSVLLEEGALGSVQAAGLTVPWWRPQQYYDEPGRGTLARDGGGVLLTQAIHTLDLFRSLLGPIDVVACQARTTNLHRMETEDLASALVTLGAGGAGLVWATTAAYPGRPESLDVIGSKGGARLEGSALRVDWLDGRSESLGDDSPTGAAEIMGFSHEAHGALIDDFCDAILTGRPPRTSGLEALKTQRLIDAMLAAAARIS